MKRRYVPILYVGMVLALFAAGFHYLGRNNRSLPRNPLKSKSASALPTGTPEAALSETNLSDIRSALEKQEYHISYDEQKKKLQSPNRRNNLRAYYEPGMLTVQTRVDTTGQGFKMVLVNEGIYADGNRLYAPQAHAKAAHHENKVQISHKAFTEEFINNEEGVRQNFIIENAPEGTRQLQVKITAKGLKVEQGTGNALRFYSETPDGETRNELVYSDLKCWDANKQPLNATLAYVDSRIQISVDVADATYPVTIDPIIANGTPQNANKVIEINQSYMHLGFSVSSAGDVNGDGYSDIIAGAPEYDLGQDGEGAAFIYPGTASGISLAAVTLQCNQIDAKMGYSVASAGDFNGDGYSDVLVGAPYYNGVFADEGRAFLYFGSAQGISAGATPMSFYSSQANAYFGIAVATAGDIDADGYSDILVSGHQFDFGQANEGIVLVAYGATSNFKKVDQLEYNQANAMFGYSVAGAGDVDADGYGDIIVGARFYTNGQGEDAEGAAFVYRGSANGLINSGNIYDKSPLVIEGNQYNAAMGNKVSSAGDVNGDGYSDILISAYLHDHYQADEGIVRLHLGSSTGINPQASQIFSFNQANAHLGSSIACAGDVNGDGYSDILLGAEYYDNGQFNEGAVFVLHGSKIGVQWQPTSTLESNQIDGWFGTAVASAGDVNGDGYSDILVGCYTFDNGQKDEGHVFVYHGGAGGIGTKDATVLTGNVPGAQMGYSVASAGDVNSDGYDDVIVGAPEYDYNGTSGGIAVVYYGSITGIDAANKLILSKKLADSDFGSSVAGAGDVNGDGYGDVLIGAPMYDNGQTDEGAAFLYYGSNSGVNAGTSILLDNNLADAYFGFSVSGAGDVNRDGYADIVIGAPSYEAGENNEGAILVYYGSVSGPTNPAVIQSNLQNAFFGGAVSSAGDVNGDGYGDIVAGASYYSSGQGAEGAAYIFHGSGQGVIANNPKILQSNQNDANMGWSVSGAGDINGDGFSDIIVGAPGYDKNESDEGVAIVYYGTGNGISEASPAPFILEANAPGAFFGSSVKSAGDVNGDGYADVIVGAKSFSNGVDHEGNIYVFHGSSSGIKSTASFSFEGNQGNAELGTAVSGAGDVNGDGYSDIIVGAPHANTDQTIDAGAALVFYGNNGKGLKNNIRLFNGDLVSPLNYNQFNQPNFVATLSARSFIGRNKGKFVWEAMSQGIPFSKIGNNPITTSNLFTGVSPNFTNMSQGGTLLGAPVTKSGIATRLRVRVRYSPVLAITGQMYGPWRYLQSQLAGYNNAPVPEEAMAETIKRKTDAGTESQGISVVPYPNPVSDKLFIKAENMEQIRGVRLLTATGKLIHQSENAAAPMDVRNLAPGMYVLLVTRQDGSQSSYKVIVKK